MPRRNKNVAPKPRGHYRPDATDELGRIDDKRQALGVRWEELSERTGISDRTFRNMRRDKRAFPRHLRALSMALRTIGREREIEAGAL